REVAGGGGASVGLVGFDCFALPQGRDAAGASDVEHSGVGSSTGGGHHRHLAQAGEVAHEGGADGAVALEVRNGCERVTGIRSAVWCGLPVRRAVLRCCCGGAEDVGGDGDGEVGSYAFVGGEDACVEDSGEEFGESGAAAFGGGAF